MDALRRTQARAADLARGYVPRGAMAEIRRFTGDELVLSGPAGTGKSRGILEFINDTCWRYPGARWLIIRKTRVSMTESVLQTFEDYVLPPDSLVLDGPQRANRHKYTYPNGSEIVLGGMDKATRVLSTEYDGIYVPEAIELRLDEWETLTGRIGRRMLLPTPLLIADTNPDQPNHWLLKRCEQGLCTMWQTRHEDNPILYDAERREWTALGLRYLGRLDKMTGARYKRFRLGQWVQAEGTVYEDFDASIHIQDRFDIPEDWRRIRVIDFGYNNPFVCQWWAISPDDVAYLYREIYWSRRIVEDHAREIVRLSQGERIECTIADHNAEDRATLERHGVPTIPAIKGISSNIQAVQSRLRLDERGKARMYFLRDSLVETDSRLSDEKLPTCTTEEIPGYVWPKGVDGKSIKEVPIDLNNHGCDCMGYLAAHLTSGGLLFDVARDEPEPPMNASYEREVSRYDRPY
jgi:phage terminase large subunit